MSQDLIAAVPTRLLIDGVWREAAGGARFPVDNPATEQVLTTVADAVPRDARAALDAACAAQESWALVAPRERGEILRGAFDRVTAMAEDFALLMTLEMGKPLAEARGEVTYGAEFLRWFSEEAVRVNGRYSMAPEGTFRMLTMKQPVGPVLMITPWNFPLAMGTRKIGPAIAAGCTMVVKPASATPLTMLLLGKVLMEAGLPAGVLNILTSSHSADIVEPLMSDPRLRKLTFTGSTEVGRSLVARSAHSLLRVSMELGGNAPFIVCEDADLGKAVEGAMVAKMRNMGQACTAANRILVHRSVHDEFVARLTARMQALTTGDGTVPGTDVGPLITARALAEVTELVDDAVRAGAGLVTGGGRVGDTGHFLAPTVLRDVPPTARIAGEEIFGPVAATFVFDDDEEAIALANSTRYGLASYVFTEDLRRGLHYADRLKFGLVGVNRGVMSNAAAPFGGVKASGFGREGGAEGIEEYLDVKYVAVDL